MIVSSVQVLRLTYMAVMSVVIAPGFAIGQPVDPSDFRAVVRSGDPVPGRPGEQFQFIDTVVGPSITQSGRTLFRATTTGNDEAIWMQAANGSLVRVLGEGDAAPGFAGTGVTVLGFGVGMAARNEADVVVISAQATGPGVIPFVNDRCIWLGVPGDLRLIARGGGAWSFARPAGGIRTGTFSGFVGLNPSINNNGRIIFSDMSNVAGQRGIWTASWDGGAGGAATLVPVMLEGEPAPGFPGMVLGTLLTSGAALPLDNSDRTLCSGLVSSFPGGPSVAFASWFGLATTAGGPPRLFAGGDPVPGITGQSFSGPYGTLTSSGRIAIVDFLSPMGLNAVLTGFPEELRIVATEGPAFPAPDVAGGAYLTGLFVSALANSGRVAISGSLAGPGVTVLNDEGVWSDATGTLRLVAREGDPAVGTSYVFDANSGFQFPAINARGELVFEAGVRNADGSNPGIFDGVWFVDRGGTLRPLAVPGGLIDIDPSPTVTVLREIAQATVLGAVGWGGGHDGNPSPINDAGQVAVAVRYFGAVPFDPGGTGVFVVQLANQCPGDFNGVGGITVQDVFDFLVAWFANAPNGDFNGVGGVTVQDVFDFLVAWFRGCP